MQEKTREALELFVEKARRLNNGSYVRFIEEVSLAISIGVNNVENIMSTKLVALDEEARDALILTYRFFIQVREPFSLNSLANNYRSNLSQNWQMHFDDLWAGVNSLLCQTPLNMSEDGNPVTSKDIVDTFIFGDMSHVDGPKRRRFLRWKSNPALFSICEFVFANTLATMLQIIFRIAFLTELELWDGKIPAVPKGVFREARLRREQKAAGWKVLLRGRPNQM